MAKKSVTTKAPADIEVLPALLSEDVSLIQTTSSAIATFAAQAVAFVQRVTKLEQRSKATLMGANALQLPTDAGSDEVLQRYAKRIQAEKKEVEEEWEITAVIHAFHRRMTSRRKVSTDALEQASERVNSLHNRYVESERRRVAEEQERLRREAEAKERQRQADEAAELERQAEEREAFAAELSPREQQLVTLIVSGVDAQIALRRVGYKDPAAAGKRLLEQPKITQAIASQLEAKQLREQAAAVKEQPVDVEVETVRPNLTKGIAVDRATWSAELLDERALINAAIAGQVPTDILKVDLVKLNEHARSLQENLNRWPGVRAKKSTRMV